MDRLGRRGKLLFLRTDLPALFAFVLFAGLIFFYLIPAFENAMMDKKRTLLREMTTSAYSVLEYYQRLHEKGLMDVDAAKQQAQDVVSTMRYGNQLKDYFWITDSHPNMIMHPYRKDLNGEDLSEYHDSKGKLIFVEFTRAVSPTGESYVEYMWQWNDDSTTIVPKLSFVRLFEPWDWIIGTGIYIEDVKTEIRRMEFWSLIISGIIGLIIIVLLTIITRQSHRIEQRRRLTEEDLFRSRDMYRTLAEASTEGVIIWTSNGIQANRTLLTMLGYAEEDFKLKNIEEIIASCDINLKSGADIIYGELEIRQFGDCVLKHADGSRINVHSDYSRILIGEKKAVVIVVRPVRHISSGPGFILPYQLLNSVSTGFFRISFGRRIRFLDATDTTLKILGFNSINELLSEPVESVFQNPGHLKNLKRKLAGQTGVSDLVVSLKKRPGYRFEALINIVITDHKFPEIWCEGSIEYLTASEPQGDTYRTVSGGNYTLMIREVPVSNIMGPVADCTFETPLSGAMDLMSEKGAEYIVIYNKNKPAGIAGYKSFAIGIASGLQTDSEAGRFISGLPCYIEADRPFYMAVEMLAATGYHPLLIKNKDDSIAGIISERELVRTSALSREYLGSLIGKSGSGEELKKVTDIMKDMAVNLLYGNCDPSAVTSFISDTADLICRKVIGMCLALSGPPPCEFAFIQTGSAGRMEQTLLSDQDNAIIFGDCNGELFQQATEYFSELGKKINEMLHSAGFNLCKGNNMAGNRRWCQPLSIWKKYFSEWIRIPDPANLLDISIFFDFRHCYGDEYLTMSLREFVTGSIATNDIYFYHMTNAWKNFLPPTLKEDPGITDIKKLLMPLTGITRLYTLKHGLTEHSTVSRLFALNSAGYFSTGMLRDTLKAFKELTSIRLRHQAEKIISGSEPDNLPDLRKASANSVIYLNNATGVISDLILKAAADFHVTEI